MTLDLDADPTSLTARERPAIAAGPVPCPNCRNILREAYAKTAIWKDDRLLIVEDIPALVCDLCVDQFYSDDVADALRRLMIDELDQAEPRRTQLVPIYTLDGRLPPARPEEQPIERY